MLIFKMLSMCRLYINENKVLNIKAFATLFYVLLLKKKKASSWS